MICAIYLNGKTKETSKLNPGFNAFCSIVLLYFSQCGMVAVAIIYQVIQSLNGYSMEMVIAFMNMNMNRNESVVRCTHFGMYAV